MEVIGVITGAAAPVGCPWLLRVVVVVNAEMHEKKKTHTLTTG
jgi:hypothetical protein